MTTSLFGRLVGAGHIEDAAIGVLRLWLPSYLWEVERQSGETAGSIALPRSYRISSEVEKMPEDQTPCVVVASPGIADLPGTNGARQYQAQWTLEASAIVSARGGMEDVATPRALRLARLYALAMRACLIQQADDESYLFRRDWIGEEYGVLPSIDDRTICVAKVRLQIEVPDVLTSDAGPIEPLGPPPEAEPPSPDSPEWPQAIDSDVEVIKTPIGEPFT